MLNPKLNLAIQILMGLSLLIGFWLAKQGRFRAHGICQSIVVLANLIPISLYMAPVFLRVALPEIPRRPGQAFYLTASIHALLGSIAEILGLYVILNAGTALLPEKLRFRNYRRWMRTELCVWWLAIIFGVATFYEWNVAGSEPVQPTKEVKVVATVSPTPTTIEIQMTNFEFEPKEIVIKPGTRVLWRDKTGRHSVKSDDGTFGSDILAAGGGFEHVFDREGTFPYYCSLHGSTGGHDMAGKVIVRR